MNRAKFFDEIRKSFTLTNKNVAGFDVIIDEAIRRKVPNNDLAYILATVWWETANTMQPIEEYGKGRGKVYGKKDPVTGQAYYGRGYVQLTWKANYERASKELGVDFVTKPELVMEPQHAVRILFDGMYEGWFTGKSIRDYIDLIDEDDKEDLREFSNGRRIINGTDKQVIIGQLAISLEKALRASGYGVVENITPVVEAPVQPSVPQREPIPVPSELEIVLRKGELDKITLLDFYKALKALYGE